MICAIQDLSGVYTENTLWCALFASPLFSVPLKHWIVDENADPWKPMYLPDQNIFDEDLIDPTSLLYTTGQATGTAEIK
jgi:hypothetical protein